MKNEGEEEEEGAGVPSSSLLGRVTPSSDETGQKLSRELTCPRRHTSSSLFMTVLQLILEHLFNHQTCRLSSFLNPFGMKIARLS